MKGKAECTHIERWGQAWKKRKRKRMFLEPFNEKDESSDTFALFTTIGDLNCEGT